MPRKKQPEHTIKRHRLLRKCRVGLLGGSFNPAHDGHVHISQQALRALDLDEIWWVVAPSNPFKDSASLASYDARLAGALAKTADLPRVFVTDFENQIHSFRTVKTLRALKKQAPYTEFVWIAGMDLIHQMHDWMGFDEIIDTIPLAFFERPPLRQSARRARLAMNPRIGQDRNAQAGHKPPKNHHIMVFRRRHTVNQSATALRLADKQVTES